MQHRRFDTVALVRWDPARQLDTFQSDIDRVFDAFFGARTANGTTRRWVPAMDLVETDDHLVLRADLPGLDKEDVEIEVKDGVLIISGERRTEHEDSADGYHRVERAYGRFSRSLSLPQGIDADQVQADFDKGVLEVRIPKPAERKPHRVQIGASVEGKAQEK
jgi:HSP20 family protein